MALKDILNFDLGRLFGMAPAQGDGTRRYWWTVRRVAPSGDRRDPSRPGVPFSPKLLRLSARTQWKGPVYWNPRVWRRDVVLVAEQLRSLIACNAPLAQGLASAAREEQRIRAGWSPQRATALLRNAAALGLLTILGAGIALEQNGLGSGNSIMLAIPMVFLALWLIRTVALNRNSRVAVYLALERRLAAGSSLSDAMQSLPRFFPRHLVDLVEAGESAGNLERAFDQFSEAMLSSLSMHRQLKLTLLYIKFVLIAQLLIAWFLLVKVVPVWVEILQEVSADSGVEQAQAPDATMPLLSAVTPSLDQMASWSQWLAEWAPVLASILVLFLIWQFVRRFRTRRSWASRGTSSLLLKIPWFSGLIVRHNLGLIALMLHGLLRAGVPLDRALAMAMGSDLLPAYRHWLSEFRTRILQGDSIRDALARTGNKRLLPPSFTGLVDAGERAGQLPAMLEYIALTYRREAEKRMHVLAALVLPAGILFMGYLTLCVQSMVFGSMAKLVEQLMV